MTVTNDFLVFAQGGGANVETQVLYAADPALSLGQQPGIASSAFNNKALRQANAVVSQVAQFIANQTQTNMQDNAVPTQMLAQISAALQFLHPVRTVIAATGQFNLRYKFFLASGNATAAATYTNNGVTFTVVATITAGQILEATGAGAPLTSGTLTKASGTGDATITFYAMRQPVYVKYLIVGGGGGGAGSNSSTDGEGGGGAGGAAEDIIAGSLLASGITVTIGAGGAGGSTAGGAGGSGGSTTLGFGTAITVTGGAGAGEHTGGAGGTVTSGSPALSIPGGFGGPGTTTTGVSDGIAGGYGGNTLFGGGGYGANNSTGNGGNGSAYGAGGGGACYTSASGGAGYQGIAIIDQFYQ